MRGNGSGWDIFSTLGSNPNPNVSSTLERTPENEFQEDLELNLSSLEWNRQRYKYCPDGETNLMQLSKKL